MYHLGPARGTSFHTAIIPDRTKIATAFSSPLPHFFLPVPGAFWCISPRPAGKISGAGGAPPRLRRPKQVSVREKTKKITFLLFFQGKIYYTIKDCIRTASRALAHGVFQPPAFFREEAACFGAATDEKIRPAYRMVVGIVIGSGIFFKAEKILNATGGDLRTGILAWIIGGLIAISNACAFAVMATRYQKVGGMVDYAEAAVGRAYGYYLGWFLAAVYYPCLTSTLAWVSARYTCVLLGYDIVSGECMTITLFYLVAAYFINTMAPRLAGKLQVSMTLIKLVPILLMAGMGTAAGLRSGMTAANFAQVTADTVTAYPLFTALAATAFAYEGWVVATTINAELKDPKRTLPLALVCGVGIIMLIYLFYYVGIAGAVPNAVMMESGEHGARLAFSTIFGQAGGTILFVFVLISCLGTCNGLMMGCTRGFYALAARGTGPKPQVLSQVDPSTGMTSNAAAAGLLACAFWGTYFYFGCLQNHLGPFRFDSSEIPIITLYAMYLPIFLGFMREAREEPPFRRFVLPALALCSGLFMVIAGILSYQWDCLYYLLFFAVFMAAGALFYKRKSL